MRNIDIIRAWKDPEYRLSLSEAEKALLPDHPAGIIELTDDEMGAVAGGLRAQTMTVNDKICCCDSVDICWTASSLCT
jgi:mersacidin/lichenicidin family type 2 lantibiotic